MRFSLRDLFWLVLVASLLCGWGVYHYQTQGLVTGLNREIGDLENERFIHRFRGVVSSGRWQRIAPAPFPSSLKDSKTYEDGKPVEYLKSDWPDAHVYVPGADNGAECAICGKRAYDGIHLVRKLRDDEYPVIP